MCLMGCYENVYQLNDNLRKFVAKSVHGGRVATKENKMWDVRGIIQVLDGRSLYPSAIHRICNPNKRDNLKFPGFPTGKAKFIRDWSKRNEFSYYIVRIKIIKIGKKQQISFVNYYDNNARIYTNEIVGDKLDDLVVDKITLEDWIDFQEIQYVFLEGIYWKGVGNNKAGDFVKNLYYSRRKYIEEGNISMSEVCKLALNSLYGKTIMKPSPNKLVIRNNDDVGEYISNNFESLIDMEECYNQSILSVEKDDVDHANMAHIGGMILSMARRIMNEVMDLANELCIPILYTDTDSMHLVDTLENDILKDSNINLLIEAYRIKYGKELIGTDLGQFGFELKYPQHTKIHSLREIVLGKKAYMHIVSGVNEKGEIETYNHCRMKGVNHYAMSEYKDDVKLYERMYDGETITFDLTYGDAVVFQFGDSVITREMYLKKIEFDGEKGSLLR